MVLQFIMFLLVGLVIGVLARWRLPKGEQGGWVSTLTFGMAGALLGGALASAFYRDGGPIVFFIAVLGAVTVLVVFEAIARRRVHG